MKKQFLAALALLCCGFNNVHAQQQNVKVARPKLVVGIVVDQMRWDYLNRFYPRFGEGGFKRLMDEGFSCDNTCLNYIPTVTAIGHTSIYTGSVPSIHGIAGNDFYKDGKKVYCTDDDNVTGVGSNGAAGKMSPRNLLVTTIGDELKLATNFRSKVIGVSLKDRASILPAGRTPDAAYWFDDETGQFITSTYYMQSLPEWVNRFNEEDLGRKLLMQDWNTLYPIETYRESTPDNTLFEKALVKGEAPVLPLKTSEIFKKDGYGIIRTTPYGNTLTLAMAKATLENEKMGQGETTDLLAVSLSSTDYIGHRFGTYAIETEDTYLRLDKDIADFLRTLDDKVGKGNYLVFLTADHAAAHNFTFMQANRISAEGWVASGTLESLNEHLRNIYGGGTSLVKDILNYQVFFDRKAIEAQGLDFCKVKKSAVDFLKADRDFAYVADMEDLNNATIPEPIRLRAVNGYNRLRSGDIQLIMQPGNYEISSASETGGTDHGVWNPYDAHIPLLFMGWGIRQGSTAQPANVTDIVPTVCALLRIQVPNGCIGNPIPAVIP